MRLAAIPILRWFWDVQLPSVAHSEPEAVAEATVDYIERRAAVRHPCHREAWLHPVTLVKFAPWHAIVMDVSTLGLGLACERPVAVGTFLAVEMPDPLTGEAKVLRVRVVHLTRQAHNYWHIGCALMAPLTEEELEKTML